MPSGEHTWVVSSKDAISFVFRGIKIDLWPLLLLLLPPCKFHGLFAGHKVLYTRKKLRVCYL